MKQQTRRQFIRTSALAGAAAHLSIRRLHAAAPPAEIGPIQDLTGNDSYRGWPTLARRSNGELVLACSGGRESHVCPFGRVELVQSRDDGKTWTLPRVILDGPIDDRDAGILETPNGSLLITTFTSLAYEPALRKMQEGPANDPRRLKWESVHHRLPSDEARQRELGQWILRSADGGVTWSHRISSIVNSPHGPIATRSGRLLYPGKELWTGDRAVGVSESRDDGLSWEWLGRIPHRDGDNPADYHELHGVECASGRLLVHIRNHNKVNSRELLQTISEDGGRTWSVPETTGIWGLPAHLLRLADGRILVTYGYRRQPYGNQARISENEGRTWSDPISISTDGGSSDLGYPSTVEIRPGEFFTAWYERRPTSPLSILRGCRWKLS